MEGSCEEAQVAIIKDEEKAPYEETCDMVDIDDDGASTAQVVRQLMLVEHQHKEVQVWEFCCRFEYEVCSVQLND